MQGLLLTNLTNNIVNIKQRMEFSDFVLCENMIDKFRVDKLFIDVGEYVCAIDGVILNKSDLFEKRNSNSMSELIASYIQEGFIDFYREFRGSFNGLIYIKETQELILFVDHYANKPLFYFIKNNKLVVSSVLKDLTDVLYDNKLKCKVNMGGIEDFLAYGFIIRNETILEGINRVPAGCSLNIRILNNALNYNLVRWHQFSQTSENEVTEEEAVEEIDRLFRKAVSLEYEKDREYGYKHISPLSAGLDSRMSNWVANELGYKDVLNTTFAQTQSLDMITPMNVAERLNHQWLFKSLNDARCLTVWDKMTPLTNGLCNYWNVAHEYLMFELIDWNKFGLYHTGMVGDAVIGSKFEEKKKYSGGFIGGNSSVYDITYREDNTLQEETEELYFLYGRAFQGANVGMNAFYRQTEVSSPFLYVELFEYCMSLPQKYRYKHRIYMKWLLEKYPEASEYSWNGIDIKEWVSNNGEMSKPPKQKKKRYIKKIYKMLKNEGIIKSFRRFFCKTYKNDCNDEKAIILTRKPLNWGMNPIDRWWEESKQIRDKMNEYFVSSMQRNRFIGLSTKRLEQIYREGLAQDKTMCITVLATLDEFGYVIKKD